MLIINTLQRNSAHHGVFYPPQRVPLTYNTLIINTSTERPIHHGPVSVLFGPGKSPVPDVLAVKQVRAIYSGNSPICLVAGLAQRRC